MKKAGHCTLTGKKLLGSGGWSDKAVRHHCIRLASGRTSAITFDADVDIQPSDWPKIHRECCELMAKDLKAGHRRMYTLFYNDPPFAILATERHADLEPLVPETPK